jgi:hypothetical protein
VTARLCLNPASLNLVRPELLQLLRLAQGEFERLLQPEQSAGPAACSGMLKQADGVLRLVELPDAAQLAAELSELVSTSPDAGSRAAQAVLHGFFVLSRHLDYLAGCRQAIPDLLVEEVNAVRLLLGRSPIGEASFAGLTAPVPSAAATSSLPMRQDLAAIKRIRHMFQVGLLGLMKGRTDPVNHHLLRRAAQRMRQMSSSGASSMTWTLLEALLDGLGSGELAIQPSRLRLLGRIDREFRAMLQEPAGTPDAGLQAELLFLACKCSRSALCTELRAASGLAFPALGDQQLAEERRLLMGVSVASIDSMARSLRGDIFELKETLERAAMAGGLAVPALADLQDRLRRVAGVLRDGGLAALASTLDTQLERLGGNAEAALGRAALSGIADALIGVEATLEGLGNTQALARRMREQVGGAATEGGVARQVLDGARQMILQSARESIEAAKRAVSAFVEGEKDPTALAAASTALYAVRGALQMLEQTRAAALVAATTEVLERCAAGDASLAPETFGESMADVLICLEYHLAALESGEEPDPLMLKLAAESLSQLGVIS